jgi:hypothetical protein
MWKVSVIVRYEALKSKLFSASSLFVLGLNCSVRRWRHYLGSKCQLCNRILGPSISLMEKVLERRTPQLSSVGLWCVWTDWNGKSHGNVPRSFVQWARDTAFHLLQAASKPPHSIPTAAQAGNVQWQQPKLGFVTVNFDASYISSNGSGASGVLIRDADGAS